MFLFLSLLQPTIHVDFRKEIGAISAIQIEKACKSLRFGGNWLVANEPRRLAVFRQNGLHAECSPLSLSIYTYIRLFRERN